MSTGAHLSEVRAGVIIARNYRVLAVLGAGSATIVLDTEHVSSRQRYALKVYDPAFLANRPGGVDGFLRTANTLSRVGGPNTIRVVAVGLLESGAPYLALEYVIGVDLGRVLAESGALMPDEAVRYIVQACDSLERAHALGLVHREVRPNNMFLVEPHPGHRILKLANYSIGTVVDGPTVSGADDRASVEYAAPEVLLGHAITACTDVWALGVTFFELVSGKRPWTANELGRRLEARLPVLSPPLHRRDGLAAPTELSAWVRRCLSEEPMHRFANAAEAKLALLQALRPPETEKMLPYLGDDEEPTRASGDSTRVDLRALGVAETEVGDAPPPSSMRGGLRPAFSSELFDAESSTLIQDHPMYQTRGGAPAQLPSFVIKQASSAGRNLVLGTLGFAIVVGLPLYYVYHRGRVRVETPEPAATEAALPAPPSIEDVSGQIEHGRVTTAASSGPQRFFMVPPPQTSKKR